MNGKNDTNKTWKIYVLDLKTLVTGALGGMVVLIFDRNNFSVYSFFYMFFSVFVALIISWIFNLILNYKK